MCEICHKSICPGGCPNAPEPPVIHYCYLCDEPIYEGDGCYNICGERYCEKCIEESHEYAEGEYL